MKENKNTYKMLIKGVKDIHWQDLDIDGRTIFGQILQK
jgi:hypothetical protein